MIVGHQAWWKVYNGKTFVERIDDRSTHRNAMKVKKYEEVQEKQIYFYSASMMRFTNLQNDF